MSSTFFIGPIKTINIKKFVLSLKMSIINNEKNMCVIFYINIYK